MKLKNDDLCGLTTLGARALVYVVLYIYTG